MADITSMLNPSMWATDQFAAPQPEPSVSAALGQTAPAAVAPKRPGSLWQEIAIGALGGADAINQGISLKQDALDRAEKRRRDNVQLEMLIDKQKKDQQAAEDFARFAASQGGDFSQLAGLGVAPDKIPGMQQDMIVNRALSDFQGIESPTVDDYNRLRALTQRGQYNPYQVVPWNADVAPMAAQLPPIETSAGSQAMIDKTNAEADVVRSGGASSNVVVNGVIRDRRTGTVVGDPQSYSDMASQIAGAKTSATELAKLDAAYPAKKTQATGAMRRAEVQLGTMDRLATELESRANGWTVGLIGKAADWIPGSPQHNLARDIDTLKAIIGFRELQALRDNSPTGGALGPVSDFENRLLQSTIANLENSQSPDQFRRNLQIVKEQAKDSWARIKEAYEQDFGGTDAASAQPPATSGAVSLDDYLKSQGF